MMRNLILTSLLAVGTVVATAPAYAGGWTYSGPHGANVTRWGGPGYGYWGHGPCCFGGGVAVGAAAGLAVGTAVGAVAARPVVPPPIVYAPPSVVYAPGGYYYVP